MTNDQNLMTNTPVVRRTVIPSERSDEGSRAGVTRASLPRSLGRQASLGMTRVRGAPPSLVIRSWALVIDGPPLWARPNDECNNETHCPRRVLSEAKARTP